MNNKPLNKNHQFYFYCEYCGKTFFENVFKVTRQSQFISKLINSNDPISQYLEPKLCCNHCFFNLKKQSYYQILSNRNSKKLISKL